jgi:ADP-L-glycero-D-manno-heptose 6-epimerase
MTELHRLRPLNMYGYSKHLFDLHAQRTGMLRRIVGMKYFNVYGPNEDHKADMRSAPAWRSASLA